MMTIRPAADRGPTETGWLSSRHTFSFGQYHDPRHMGFRALRVINDDRVIPGAGFPRHGHRDMEIISYVLDGALEHKDSMGNGAVVRPGEVQLMSAGTGVLHSEYNHSDAEPVHFLQIWIQPERTSLSPRYEQRAFPRAERLNRFRLVASRDGRDGSVTIRQDADLHVAVVERDRTAVHRPAAGRHVWLHVARGLVTVNGVALREGDGAAFTDGDEGPVEIAVTGTSDAEVLLFDLA